MTTALIILSGVLVIASAIPYIIDIRRGKAKPRIVSWATWGLLTTIACFATFAAGEVASGIFLICSTIAVFAIVALGFRHGDRKFERLDIACQLAVLVGLALWLIFNSPAVAVMAAVTIDLIGAIPTFKHSWLKPHEETWISYALSGIAGGITLLALTEWTVTGAAYPLYFLLINIVLVALLLASPHRKLAGEPAEVREL